MSRSGRIRDPAAAAGNGSDGAPRLWRNAGDRLRSKFDSVGAPPRSGRLWNAWERLAQTEDEVRTDLGAGLGADIVVLWALARLADNEAPDPDLADLFDEQLRPRFSDGLVEDIASVAFALGTAWALNGRNEQGARRPERAKIAG